MRLIPPSHLHIRNLFNHRLTGSTHDASNEFQTLLDGTHGLYSAIASPQALLIRSILSHLNLEILKRARPPSNTFNFQSASVGNLFLTGARLFSGSFESAIYLLALIGGVDESRTAVVPSVSSNFTHHIAAGLEDGMTITGQNAISHPSEPTALRDTTPPPELENEEEDANPPSTLPTLRGASIAFTKAADASPPLTSRISSLWYINHYGHKVRPSPNSRAVSAIKDAETIIYSIGSLYTSIIPCIILKGVGAAIATSRFKILLLNGSLDRESAGLMASDFIAAVARACEESQGVEFSSWDKSKSITCEHVRRYVTHLIYIEGEGAPVVDKDVVDQWGVECVRSYGRKGEDGTMRYDGKGLAQALGAILGKRDPSGIRSRRSKSDFSLNHPFFPSMFETW